MGLASHPFCNPSNWAHLCFTSVNKHFTSVGFFVESELEFEGFAGAFIHRFPAYVWGLLHNSLQLGFKKNNTVSF
jgi:hypothetical protein